MTAIVFLSFCILAAFIGLGVCLFGLLRSYSAYAAKWTEELPLHNVHVWSLVTIVAAFLMVPPMIDAGEGNPLQFLGFFAPLYLILVGLTPEWETSKGQHRVHMAGAIVCALCAFAWLVLVRHLWYIVLIFALIFAGIAYLLKRFDAYVFWGEMIMFTSVYAALV